jgi:UPF0755 protein
MNKNRINIIYLIIPVIIIVIFTSCIFDVPQTAPTEEEAIPAGQQVKVVIEPGMNLTQIAGILEEAGVVDSALLFRLFVQQKQKEKSLAPGEYDMVTGSEYEKVLEILTTGPPFVTYTVTIPEGFTIVDIIERYSSELSFISRADMEEAVRVENYGYGYLDGLESLEGFLFPKTYELLADYRAADIVDMMLAQYQFETGDLDYSIADQKGFTSYDILKIASMVEREAYIPEERSLISAVMHNRLDIDMPLGIDATLTYFLQKWDEPLTESDLETDTPYNTRIYAGLPPSPICNPGLASIIAALEPADVDYLYFVVTNSETHEHSFTNDYNEHLNNINNAN